MSASKYVFGNGCTHVAIHINRNQEELLQWSLAAKQKDEDRAALEKYDQIDNQKIKALVESCFFYTSFDRFQSRSDFVFVFPADVEDGKSSKSSSGQEGRA